MCHLTKMISCGAFLLVHRHLHLDRKRTQPFYTTRRVSGHNLRQSRAPFRTAVTHKVYQCAKVQKLYLAALFYLCTATFTLSVSEHNPFTQPAASAAITCGEAAPLYLEYPSITALTLSRMSVFSLSMADVSTGCSTFSRLTTGTFSAPSGTGVFSTPTTWRLFFSLA